MAHLGSGIEYGLHCLLWLIGSPGRPKSSRDLAELQGISPTFVAKIFWRLEKAGIVRASEGFLGGYMLARPPEEVTVLDVVDAIEGEKPLFDCKEVRGRCAVFGGSPPAWSTSGVCAIHAVMLRAEESMRAELSRTTLLSLTRAIGTKMPSNFPARVQDWFSGRIDARTK